MKSEDDELLSDVFFVETLCNTEYSQTKPCPSQSKESCFTSVLMSEVQSDLIKGVKASGHEAGVMPIKSTLRLEAKNQRLTCDIRTFSWVSFRLKGVKSAFCGEAP